MHNKLIKITTAAALISVFGTSAAADETCLTLAGNAKAVYTVNVVVDSLKIEKDNVKVYFKYSTNGASYMSWSNTDKNVSMLFLNDGKEMHYIDLQESDVMTVSYDAYGREKRDMGSLDFCHAKISRWRLSGTVEKCDEERHTVTVNGYECRLNDDLGYPDIGYDSEFYLDSEWNIAYYEECLPWFGYAIVTGMYKDEYNEYPTVKMIEPDARIVEYECKNNDEALAFYNAVAEADPNDNIEPMQVLQETETYFTKHDIEKAIKTGGTLFRYKLNNNRIRFDRRCDPILSGQSMSYYSNAQFGKYKSYHTPLILDMDEYLQADEDVARLVKPEELTEGERYKVTLYNNTYGQYRLAMLYD